MDLALNNLQRLICHKTKQTKPNQTSEKPSANADLKNSYEKIIMIRRTCEIVYFAVAADLIVKLKGNKKKDKYLDLARELKKKNCGT